jgi:protein-tyrosine phosphatase
MACRTRRFVVLFMIDLHCHLLPGIDDGSPDLETSLEMARIAVDDGITTIFCTPHIYPGLYENTGPDIQRRVAQLQTIFRDKGIALDLSYGADVHLVPEINEGLRTGRVPTLGGSRYLLLEPSHNVRPPRFVESVFALIGAGYTPVITHPERLTWIADHYEDFTQLAKSGAWLQVTAAALQGTFGKYAQLYAERFVGEGWTAVLATDAHTTNRRAPRMREACRVAERLVGRDETRRMVVERPQLVVSNANPHDVVLPPALLVQESENQGKIRGLFSRLLGQS